jgi:hypothetical protein
MFSSGFLIASEMGCRMEYRTSPASEFKEFEGSLKLPQGDYWFEYRSVDISGNMEETRRKHILVDTEEPTVSYRIHPPRPDGKDEWFVTNPELSFQWTDDHESVIFCSLDNSDWMEWKGSMSIPEGIHLISIMARDPAGLESKPLEVEIKVDTDLPETSFSTIGAKVGRWHTTIPMVILESNEPGEIYYRWSDESDFSRYSDSISPPLEEGEIRLFYYSADLAGNEEEETSYLISVDIVKPVPVLEWSIDDGGKVFLDSSSTSDGTNLRFRFLLDGKLLRDWSENPKHSFGLKPGDYTVTVEVMDEAGNIDSRSSMIEVEGPPYLIYISSAVIVLVVLTVISYLLIMRRKKTNYYSDYNINDTYYDSNPNRKTSEYGGKVVAAVIVEEEL